MTADHDTRHIEPRRDTAYRRDILWYAAMIHRLSGLALICFLPLHFLALGLAIEGEAMLEGFLRWSDNSAVKVAETGLVVMLVVHVLGGIRVLVIENIGLPENQKTWASAIIILAALVGFAFLIRLV